MTPQELKESILWNAIRGKFTTQDPRESVSGVLGKTQLTPVAEEDANFEIPGNWCWARIGEIFDLVNGKAFKPTDWSESGIPIVRIQNLNDPNAPFNCFSGEIEEKFILHGGELLFSWSGTPGTSFGAFIWNGGHAVLNQHIFIVYPKIKLDYEYAKYAINGELRIFIAKAHGGAGLKHITRKEFDSCFLPIPPLAEQKRIVAKIEELLPLIERYEKAWSRLEDFNKRFPVDMQKSILQMAIQGKLVEQRPEEGTGEELYRRIQSEEIETIKTVPMLSDEEIPFGIPESWIFVRVENIAILHNGRAYKQNELLEKGKYPVLRVGNLFTNNKWYYSDLELESTKYCDKGDLLYSWSASFGPYIWDGEKVVYHYHIWKIEFSKFIDKKYLFYLLLADTDRIKQSGHGLAMIHVTKAGTEKRVLPLPPLAEQKRIVARLEELLPLCERLK